MLRQSAGSLFVVLLATLCLFERSAAADSATAMPPPVAAKQAASSMATNSPSLMVVLPANLAGGEKIGLVTSNFTFKRNAELCATNAHCGHVRWSVDNLSSGEVFEPQWTLPALPAGKHELWISLVDSDGHPWAGALAQTTMRVVTRIADAKPTNSTGPVRTSELVLTKGGKHALTQRVTQGETVRIAVRAALPLDLHLHGYDIAAPVGPDAPLIFQFRATVAGRFPLESHGDDSSVSGHSHGALLYLEVLPK